MLLFLVAGPALAAGIVGPDDATGDWNQFGADPAGDREALAPGIQTGDIHDLDRGWATQLGGPVSGTPIIVAGTVLVGDMSGNVTALDADSGAIAWRTDLMSPISSTIAVDGDRVFAVTLAHATLNALSLSDGSLLWRESVAGDSAGWGSPLVTHGFVIVGASGGDDGYASPRHRGSVQAYDETTGRLAWRTFLADEDHAGSNVWTTPIAVGDTIIVGTGNPYDAIADPHADAMVALSLTNGTVLWTNSFMPGGNSDGIDDDFGSSPIAFVDASGRELVAEFQKYGGYHVAVAATGEQLLNGAFQSLDIIGTPTAADGCVVVARQMESAQAPGGSYSSPALAEGGVYLGYQNGWGKGAHGGVVCFRLDAFLIAKGRVTHESLEADAP